jgi:hypothetical protein
VIEGACRHLVKDRLERAGMHWTPEGAQAMLDLRNVWIARQRRSSSTASSATGSASTLTVTSSPAGEASPLAAASDSRGEWAAHST